MKVFIITQRSEDGTGYYTGGRCSGLAFDREFAKEYTTRGSANRRARQLDAEDIRHGVDYVGPNEVIPVEPFKK